MLELLKTPGNRAALVIDEYGGLQGIVTLSDVLQAIIGDIPIPGESFEPQVVEREDGSYLFDGQLQMMYLKIFWNWMTCRKRIMPVFKLWVGS